MEATEAKDVMISYSHSDKDFMLRLRDALEDSGISVWVDQSELAAGIDFLSKIGQAIVDAKVFLSLLSSKTVSSKYCQDELALAYISSKPIFPVGLEPQEDLYPAMDTGMKLQLVRYEWCMFLDPGNFHNDFHTLEQKIKRQLQTLDKENADSQQKEAENEKRPKRPKTGAGIRPRLSKDGMVAPKTSNASSSSGSTNHAYNDHADDKYMTFWDRNFSEESKVPWERFHQVFLGEYNEELNALFKPSEHEWLCEIIKRELLVKRTEGFVSEENYLSFCTADNVAFPFWHRVQDQALESYAMKEVFNMESSVRMDAIESLAKFKSSAVIDALMDLLTDPDPNVRAVASISLAKTGVTNEQIIERLCECLDDSDRLVEGELLYRTRLHQSRRGGSSPRQTLAQ